MKIFNILSEEAVNRKVAKIKLSILSDHKNVVFILLRYKRDF